MEIPGTDAPGTPALEEALRAVFRRGTRSTRHVRVIAREPATTSTFPSEHVTCLVGKDEVQLFCKYEAGRHHGVYGHRGGVSYEAAVYREVLGRFPGAGSRFHGAYHCDRTGDTWLFLEFLDAAERVDEVSFSGAVRDAARWSGAFHAAQATAIATPAVGRLNHYDASYYLGWIERTRTFARPLLADIPWLDDLCSGFEHMIPYLLDLPQTVIHGEYYPRNILYRSGAVYPIDWESAAIAPGEIDLAMLIDGWPPDSVLDFIQAYSAARWPEGVPEHFATALQVARVYVHLRWLGDRPDWTTGDHSRWRFDDLRRLAAALGLVPAPEAGSPL